MRYLSRFFIPLVLLWVLPAEAANRFAVCTVTCTWDASSTAMWSTTTGGAIGASAPGTGDAVVFDGATCVGGVTCTITLNAPNNVQSITSGACTASTTGCIIDNSVNNNNITLSGNVAWSNSGTGTRNVKLGSATYTISTNTCTSDPWTWTTTTNLTFSAGTSTINFTGSYSGSTGCTFALGALSYNNVNFSGSGNKVGINISGSNIFASLSFTAPGNATFVGSITNSIGTLAIAGSNSSPFLLASSASNAQTTINLTTSATITATGFKGIIFTTTAPTVTGWDFGDNSGFTAINAPSTGGGPSGILRSGVGG